MKTCCCCCRLHGSLSSHVHQCVGQPFVFLMKFEKDTDCRAAEMRPLCIILALLCEICQVPADIKKTSGITQDSGVIKAKEGTNVTLRCVCRDDAVTFFYWYQQSLGGKLEVISIRMKEKAEAEISPGYKERFGVSAQSQDSSNHLTITDLRPLDSAAYFCGTLEFNAIEFGQGAFLYVNVKGSGLNIQARVHQSASETIQPGGSVNLSCTVHTGTCDGEYSVYWFKNSEEPHPGLIYTHGDRDDQCERKSNTQTHSCTYNLSIRSLDLSHAGTYYCAVASCGHVLFGNGTKLDFDREKVLLFFIQRCNFNMTTSTKFAFYLTCFLLGKMAQMNNFNLSTTVHRDSEFMSVDVGDNLTLQCFYDSDATKYYWYKQTLGQKPQIISMTYRFSDSSTFHGEFKDNPRFKQKTFDNLTQLKISDVQLSDSATYYCARGTAFIFKFIEDVTSASETVQPGGSVNLSCTVHIGTCDGEYSVYWFKNSEEPHPGLIYTHGDRDDQCERKSNTQTHSCTYNFCTYNLSMKSLDLSHAGTYYCAVASCGHVLFGNGTKLDFDDKVDCHTVSVYFMSGALIFTTILSVLLAFLLYKRNCCRCSAHNTGPQLSSLCPPHKQTFIIRGDSEWLLWYKQTPGQEPSLISTFYVFNIKTTFNHELKNNPRFSLTPENGTFHLFADGIAVSVESSGLNIQALVHHWASETVQPGGSVTLSCTVHTGTCDREHNVYWFKNSEESHPGLINSRGDGDDHVQDN
ncbi:putative immune-type receptor 5, partial [Scophthalmus maximus]